MSVFVLSCGQACVHSVSQAKHLPCLFGITVSLLSHTSGPSEPKALSFISRQDWLRWPNSVCSGWVSAQSRDCLWYAGYDTVRSQKMFVYLNVDLVYLKGKWTTFLPFPSGIIVGVTVAKTASTFLLLAVWLMSRAKATVTIPNEHRNSQCEVNNQLYFFASISAILSLLQNRVSTAIPWSTVTLEKQLGGTMPLPVLASKWLQNPLISQCLNFSQKYLPGGSIYSE